MKILKFHMRFIKTMQSIRIQYDSHENHGNPSVPLENLENHEHHRIPLENNENN